MPIIGEAPGVPIEELLIIFPHYEVVGNNNNNNDRLGFAGVRHDTHVC